MRQPGALVTGEEFVRTLTVEYHLHVASGFAECVPLWIPTARRRRRVVMPNDLRDDVQHPVRLRIDSASVEQYSVEIYYRIQLSQEFHVTPSLQTIIDPVLNPDEDFIDPVLNPDEDFIVVAGIRFRAEF